MDIATIQSKWEQLLVELLRIMQEHEQRAIDLETRGLSPEDHAAELLVVRREENKALAEACARHKRELDYLAGEHVPMAHEGAAVLLPVTGLEA